MDKRALRKRSAYFSVKQGDTNLYYNGGKLVITKPVCESEELSLVVQSTITRRDLIKDTHDRGHFGRNKTYAVLKDRFYWPNMFTDILEFVSPSIAIYNCLLK